MSAKREPPPDPTVGSLTLHIPPLFPSNPELWFALDEFRIISNTSHFRWAAGRLSPDVTFRFMDVTVSSRSYDTLKEAVISRSAPTEDQRLRQLLQGIELENKMPSEGMREMRLLRGPTFGDDPMLRELRYERIPPYLSSLPSTAREYSLEKGA